jgi:hypothetical protein
MTTNGKDVIYVDVDDEITNVIDKTVSAKSSIVALVLPKRATVFQGIVNMKLLKRRADDAKKHLVLITSEPSVLSLAGAVGVHVAKTLQSKPELPVTPIIHDGTEEVDEDAPMTLPPEDFDAKKASNTAVGDLAGVAAPTGAQMAEETIELDNTDLPVSDAAQNGEKVGDAAALAAAGGAGKSGKGKKNKKLKVPNFDKFRLKLVLAAALVILLIVGWVVANMVLPKATVTIATDTSNVNSSLSPTLDTSASTVDTANQVVPAKVEQIQKSYTGQASASGKQNNGTQATGTVTMTATACAPNLGTPIDVPAGTGISTNGLTFITQSNASFSFHGFSGGSCANYTSGPVAISAQTGGTQYNVADGTSFSVSGRSDVSATGSATGGTDNIITVIQQSDIDSAKQKAEQSIDKSAIQQQLQQTLQGEGYYAVTATFKAGNPQSSASAKVGDQTGSVTYTENVTYTMFGAKKSDLQQLVDSNVNSQIDTSKQTIQNDGLDNADISVPNPGNATKVQLSMQVTSVVGPHLDNAALKKAIVGKKSGDVQSIIKSNPGVQSVSVKFSPFWVNKVPKNANKITFVFVKSSTGNANSQ